MIKISEMPDVGPNDDTEFGHIVQDGINRKANVLFVDSDNKVPYLEEMYVTLNHVAFITSFANQAPSSTGVAYQVQLDPQGSSSDPIEVDSAGNITINKTNHYNIFVGVQFGRDKSNGIAGLLARVLVNGVQEGVTIVATMDDQETRYVHRVTLNRIFFQGDVITIELMRDTAGINEGGIYTVTPSDPTWSPTPSIFLDMAYFSLLAKPSGV